MPIKLTVRGVKDREGFEPRKVTILSGYNQFNKIFTKNDFGPGYCHLVVLVHQAQSKGIPFSMHIETENDGEIRLVNGSSLDEIHVWKHHPFG